MKFFALLAILALLTVFTSPVAAHFPVYSLYKERKPVDLFQALASARQAKRRAGGFEEMYELPMAAAYYPRN